MQDFNDLYWHDAELQKIVIDRSNPGHKDEVKLLVWWPDTEETDWVVFSDCYELDAKMNFGIVAYESILGASCSTNTQRIKELLEKWSAVKEHLQNLKCFQIKCNSTGSELNIYAKHFKLVKYEPT